MALENFNSENAAKSLAKYQVAKRGISSQYTFFASEKSSSAPGMHQATKDSILRDFIYGFKQVNNTSPQIQQLNPQQIQQLLSQ